MKESTSLKLKQLRNKAIVVLAPALIVGAMFEGYSYALINYTTRANVERVIVREVVKHWSKADIEAEIRLQAGLYDLDADKMVAIAKCESNLNPVAMNKQSTATGVYQIINGTWKAFKCTGGITTPQDNIHCGMKIAVLGGLGHWPTCSK